MRVKAPTARRTRPGQYASNQGRPYRKMVSGRLTPADRDVDVKSLPGPCPGEGMAWIGAGRLVHPGKPPPRLAAGISAVGHKRPPAPLKKDWASGPDMPPRLRFWRGTSAGKAIGRSRLLRTLSDGDLQCRPGPWLRRWDGVTPTVVDKCDRALPHRGRCENLHDVPYNSQPQPALSEVPGRGGA